MSAWLGTKSLDKEFAQKTTSIRQALAPVAHIQSDESSAPVIPVPCHSDHLFGVILSAAAKAAAASDSSGRI